MKSLLIILKSLLDDFERLYPGVKGLDRDFVTIKARVENEGYSFLTVALPSFGKALDKSLDEGRFCHPLGFKLDPKGSLPRFLSGLTANVFDAKTGLLLDNASGESVKILRELCFVFKKMGLSSSREEILDKQAKNSFFACDRSIISLPLDKIGFYRHVCSFVLPNLDRFDTLKCKHGPGAVAEGYTPNQKWLGIYRGLSEFDHRLMSSGYDIWSFSKFQAVDEPLVQSSSCGLARLVTVAKSSTSRRTITVEPLISQFVQQGLNNHLRREISKDPILSLCLALETQEPNQKLALESSRTREFSTLDLSSASDLLSNELVKETFAKRPRFNSLSQSCRSDRIDSFPEQSLQKFAGMGNALTFPVQSTVFALIAISAILFKKGSLPSYKDVVRTASTVRVFGDDIIVKTDQYHQVVDWLTSFGLKVNQSKSFTKGNFRESCGVDAWNGINVTPLYLRHEPGVTSITPNAIENFVSISNQAWLRGLYKFSSTLKDYVEKSLRRRLPLVSSRSSSLGWHNRQEAFEFQRWNKNLHRFEVKGLVGQSRERNDQLDDYAALLKFFHTPLLGRDDGHLQKSDRRFTLSHRTRWVHAA